jgi:trimethylamine--corrinoid protein Co-methyltransferase
MTVSLEKFIVDAENLAMMQRFLQGLEINDETLALESIAEVGPAGHHFGTLLTQTRFETAFHISTVADRQNYDAWFNTGKPTTIERANKVWKDILNRYEAPPLDTDKREAVEDYVARRERELAGMNLYADE